MAATTIPAHQVARGDTIIWNYRSQKLGQVEVFDTYPAAPNAGRPTITLVMVTASGAYRYARADADLLVTLA